VVAFGQLPLATDLVGAALVLATITAITFEQQVAGGGWPDPQLPPDITSMLQGRPVRDERYQIVTTNTLLSNSVTVALVHCFL
jgi:hypothetical protein